MPERRNPSKTAAYIKDGDSHPFKRPQPGPARRYGVLVPPMFPHLCDQWIMPPDPSKENGHNCFRREGDPIHHQVPQ